MPDLPYKKEIIIAGGGAAGFFGAITAARSFPECRVTILEKTGKLLSKVKVSGGGRCNVTHACFETGTLSKNYPRGAKPLRSAFTLFSPVDTIAWFRAAGVELKTEPDGRMFPVTDNSQTVIDALLAEARNAGVTIRTQCGVERMEKQGDRFLLYLTNGDSLIADRVLVATGGNPKAQAYQWLNSLGHSIISPVPSLFTFNIPNSSMHDLAGISVPDALVRVEGTRFEYRGPLLITHWGLSGPAVLKTSAFAARELAELKYHFKAHIRWQADLSEEIALSLLQEYRQGHGARLVSNKPPVELPARLWQRLLLRAGLQGTEKWAEVPRKPFRRLVEELVRGVFEVQGKTTFKEEFVTAGGINFSEVDKKTMESRLVPGLYFAGEVLDADGITGGFNFQAAWTTGYLAGLHIGR